jgi:hypothetical protein
MFCMHCLPADNRCFGNFGVGSITYASVLCTAAVDVLESNAKMEADLNHRAQHLTDSFTSWCCTCKRISVRTPKCTSESDKQAAVGMHTQQHLLMKELQECCLL